MTKARHVAAPAPAWAELDKLLAAPKNEQPGPEWFSVKMYMDLHGLAEGNSGHVKPRLDALGDAGKLERKKFVVNGTRATYYRVIES